MINLHFMVFKMLIIGLCYGFSNVWAVDIVFHDLYISYTFKSIHVVKVGDLIAPKVYVSSTVKISKFRCQHEQLPHPHVDLSQPVSRMVWNNSYDCGVGIILNFQISPTRDFRYFFKNEIILIA